MVIELPKITASRLESLQRSLGKSQLETLDFALKAALDELEAERVFRAPNSHVDELSDDEIMAIATEAVKADRQKHRS
jgi:hypothetical protein